MHQRTALHETINHLHHEADSLAAVAALCYNGFADHDLEHIHAAHLQQLLHGFATRFRTIAEHLEHSSAPEPATALGCKTSYTERRNGHSS